MANPTGNHVPQWAAAALPIQNEGRSPSRYTRLVGAGVSSRRFPPWAWLPGAVALSAVAVPARADEAATSPPAPAAEPALRDYDRDRIADLFDQCPWDPEVWNGSSDHDGCPEEDYSNYALLVPGIVGASLGTAGMIAGTTLFSVRACKLSNPAKCDSPEPLHSVGLGLLLGGAGLVAAGIPLIVAGALDRHREDGTAGPTLSVTFGPATAGAVVTF